MLFIYGKSIRKAVDLPPAVIFQHTALDQGILDDLSAKAGHVVQVPPPVLLNPSIIHGDRPCDSQPTELCPGSCSHGALCVSLKLGTLIWACPAGGYVLIEAGETARDGQTVGQNGSPLASLLNSANALLACFVDTVSSFLLSPK